MAWLISVSSDATRFTFSATISVIVTFAPSLARANAVARPIPRGEPAPVTKATFPSNLFMFTRIPSFLSHHTCFCRIWQSQSVQRACIDVTFQYITIKQLYKLRSHTASITLRSPGSQAKLASELVVGLFSRPTHP